MCQGHSSRASFGGAVARIHPAGASDFSCLLQFQNSARHSDPTTLSYKLEHPQPCKLRIHQFGDLSSSLTSAGRVLHSVNLLPITSSSSLSAENTTGSVVLDRRLDLGVGEEGIIGRVISIVVDGGSEPESMLLGEGIIGWN